jgi:hypothetical protein
MLAKLLSLLIHAKSGAISGMFLLGATGALVSVSASNGVTTITITEASPSPSVSASPNVPARSARPSPSRSSGPSLSAVTAPTTAACADEAKALAFQVQRVNTAFTGLHTDLEKLGGLRERGALMKADGMLRLIRHAAVKAVHATATPTCAKKDDDEDENDDDDKDANDDHEDAPKSIGAAVATTLSFVEEPSNDEDNDDHGHKLGLTFTGDAKAIADQAIAAMQVAFDAAKNAPAKTPKVPTESRPRTAHPSTGPDQRGEHRD